VITPSRASGHQILALTSSFVNLSSSPTHAPSGTATTSHDTPWHLAERGTKGRFRPPRHA
jgi:hypothetical protein